MSFGKGDSVRLNVQGSRAETVRVVTACAVFTYENLADWYHPTKVVRA